MAEFIFRDKNQYNCSICLELMKDPVTIPCGHSYCMSCIESCWDSDNLKRNNCPQCRQQFVPRPSLNKNVVLAEMLGNLGGTEPQDSQRDQASAEPGDIECDFCTERNIRAVKSCLECRASYCQIHLQPHYDIPALMRHNLVKATNIPTCPKHDKLLEVFCRTDQKCICALCLLDDHRGHDTVSSAKERDEKQAKLVANKSQIADKCKEKEKQLHELQKAAQSHAIFAQQAVDDAEKAFTESVAVIRRKCSEVKERIRAQEKAHVDKLEDHCEQLELEIAMLRAKGDMLDKLLQTGDNIYFLQNFEIMPTSSGADFPSLPMKQSNSFENVSKTVSKFKKKLEDFCEQEVDKILESAAVISPSQIKLGDKVRVKSSVKTPKYNWGSNVTHKSIGVVTAVNGDTLIINFPGQSNWTGALSEMELVTEANESGTLAQNSSIKVGDRVRVKSSVDTPKHKWGLITHQSVGVVKSLDGEVLTADFPEHLGWKGIVSEMEVVSADNVSDRRFHIGDKVRVKSTVRTPKYQWGSVSHKSVGEVTAIQENTVIVNFPECKGWKGLISEMELIPSKNSETCGFKLGDRVRVKASVKNPEYNWGSISHKSVGNVKALKMVVDFPEQSGWVGAISEMELAQ